MNAYSSYAGNDGRRVEDRVRDWFWDACETVDREFHQSVAYVNSVVVPEVRRESGQALRVVAGHLERLADRLDPAGRQDGRR